MGIADRLVLHRAQSETLRRVVGRLLQAPVVEHQHLGLLVFEEELAVVGAFQGALEMPADLRGIEARTVDEGGGRGIGHDWVPD
jgi:hypothetical protein